MNDFADDEEYESSFDELESRIDELATRVDELSVSPVYVGISGGYCVGAALATVLSWDANNALGWAAIHGFLSWIYVLYYAARHWSAARIFYGVRLCEDLSRQIDVSCQAHRRIQMLKSY